MVFNMKYNNEKIDISIGQALLIIINELTQCGNIQEVKNLKEYYLAGFPNESIKNNWLEKLITGSYSHYFKDYNIKTDPASINKDPSRRYFETCLAAGTLKKSLKELNTQELIQYNEININSILETETNEFVIAKLKEGIQNITSGIIKTGNPIFLDTFLEEYGDLVSRCTGKNDAFESLQEFLANQDKNVQQQDEEFQEFKEKFKLLAISGILSILNCNLNQTTFPVNKVYGNGYYNNIHRGRETKKNQHAGSLHLGLMKSHMPVPYYGITMTNHPFPYTRPADRSSYNINSAWPKKLFSQLVHPFSSSISSTILAQWRTLLFFLQSKSLPIKADKIPTFIKAFISVFLYNSGGHGVYEFLFPFRLQNLEKPSIEIIDADIYNKINIKYLFLDTNEIAFNNALNQAIDYNNQIIKKYKLNHQIVSNKHCLKRMLKKVPFEISSSPEQLNKENNLSGGNKYHEKQQKNSTPSNNKKRKEQPIAEHCINNKKIKLGARQSEKTPLIYNSILNQKTKNSSNNSPHFDTYSETQHEI